MDLTATEPTPANPESDASFYTGRSADLGAVAHAAPSLPLSI